MAEQFQNMLAAFGISGAPQTFAELIPWLVTVLACMAIFFGIVKLMFGLMRYLNRWR